MSTSLDVLVQSGSSCADILTTNVEVSNTATMKKEFCVYMIVQLAAATQIYTKHITCRVRFCVHIAAIVLS